MNTYKVKIALSHFNHARGPVTFEEVYDIHADTVTEALVAGITRAQFQFKNLYVVGAEISVE